MISKIILVACHMTKPIHNPLRKPIHNPLLGHVTWIVACHMTKPIHNPLRSLMKARRLGRNVTKKLYGESSNWFTIYLYHNKYLMIQYQWKMNLSAALPRVAYL